MAYTRFPFNNLFSTIILSGSIGGSLTLSAAATTTPYSLVFPAAQGANGTTLVNNGSGVLSWAAGGGGGTEWGDITGTLSDQLDLQSALNAKAPLASPTFSGTITTPLTASRALVTGASSQLAVSATTATELGYVNGVTSAIQTQLNGKVTGGGTTVANRFAVWNDTVGGSLINSGGLGFSNAFGTSDPILYGVGTINFRVQGASGVDAGFFNSAGSLLLEVSGQCFGPLNSTNIDLGTSAARFRDAYLKSALFITAGNNQVCGTATLTAGTVTVSNTRITASSLIFVECNAVGGTQGILSAPTASIVAGTSFVINSSNAADTSTVRWFFIN